MYLLTLSIVSIFLLLSLLHFSWAMGGSWGFEASIPKTTDGEWVMKPKKTDSAIVGLGLLLFAIFYLIRADHIPFELPPWAVNIAEWLIPSIFLFRAIGDFKYVGFFKKVKTTEFARNDSNFFSPLCIVIALIGFIIGII
ncbi:DUF3995 domain-containing protein [Ekhidna sp.]|uniref:DUF3995 domain-containing protein n=1 Tax=Ekhidna sp. TaxID=2608089 RepID=UPI0032EB6DFF